jgi:hypothetical protein
MTAENYCLHATDNHRCIRAARSNFSVQLVMAAMFMHEASVSECTGLSLAIRRQAAERRAVVRDRPPIFVQKRGPQFKAVCVLNSWVKFQCWDYFRFHLMLHRARGSRTAGTHLHHKTSFIVWFWLSRNDGNCKCLETRCWAIYMRCSERWKVNKPEQSFSVLNNTRC